MAKAALVVLSGGQDSTTCLFWAKKMFESVHAITFNYNQRHSIEIEAAKTIAQRAKVDSHEIVDLGPVLKGKSTLVNKEESLETYKDFNTMSEIIGSRIELTFVPMRNFLFLTVAANRASCMNINHLVTGVCEADGSNYPDCRESFITAMERTITDALGTKFFIHTPLIHAAKAETVKLALRFPGCFTALAYSHTAYDGGYPPNGKDHASVLRAHGFEEAGLPDPLIVRAVLEGKLHEAPKTDNYKPWVPDVFYEEGMLSPAEVSSALREMEDNIRRLSGI